MIQRGNLALGAFGPYNAPVKRWLFIAIFLAGSFGVVQGTPEVWLLRIEGEIGRGTVSYVRAGLAQAAAAGAAAAILEFSTPGGYLDAASAARDVILDAPLPTIAYVHREAFSAGALLAIACGRIYFDPAGVMGAATPVYFEDSQMREAPEKTVSAVRKLFKATAEARGRPPEVAEAMVDRDVVIPNLVERGKLLTLTANEAAQWGYSDGEVADLGGLLVAAGLPGAAVVRFSPRWVDSLAATLTSPWVAAILITVGVLGLIVEALTPGFGLPGTVGIGCLGLFFWAHYFVGLAGWESLVFFVGGAVAMLLEVFVFTASDFGLAGLLGLVLIGLGFYTAMVGPFTRPDEALGAVGAVSGGLVAAVVGVAVLLTRLPKSRLRLGGVILSSTITGRATDRGTAPAPASPWVGRRGVAASDLHPVGVGDFGGERVDVTCEEGFLPKGTAIVVVRDEGYRKVVRRIEGGE
jgi:membrane-bound serine protease (ClpP class)